VKFKKIYIAVTNDLVTDNRVHKVALSLLKSGADITLLGRIKRNSPAINRTYNTKRFKLIFTRGPLFYFEYNLRLFIFLLFHKFDIVVSNDLDTLGASFYASKIKNKKLVYDSHEYFTEVPELYNRNFPKKVWMLIEQLTLPRVKYCYTVSDSIADTYNNKYGINMKVVRNVPYKNLNIQSDFNDKEIKTILYQGSLNIGRGLEHLIDAMEFVDNARLVIIGDGDITIELNDQISKKNLQEKVQLKGRIPFEKLSIETQKADLGIALEENLGLNYYYALPNKLFDYIQAGVPVLVSPFPEMQKIVNNYEIGTIYDHKNPKELAAKITEIFELKNRYQKWKSNTSKAAQDLCWENEEQILKDVFSKVGLKF
jgi:glycosyltransferase involved in cell wall biosynthesis